MTHDYRDSARVPLVVLVLCVIAAAYQAILALSEGLYQFETLIVSIAVVIGAIGAVLMPAFWSRQFSCSLVCIVAAAVAVLQFIAMPLSKHFHYYTPATSLERIIPIVGFGLAVLCSIVALTSRTPLRRWLIVVASLQFLVAALILHRSLEPIIDVYFFHQESAAAFLEGKNPYAVTFRNVYLEPDGSPSRFYSLEVQKDGRVMFGFPYPPMSMWMYLPSYWLTGESRYAHAAALMLAGLGIGFVSRGMAGMAAAVLLLTAPAQWVVIENAWTEPFLLLALVGVALAATRTPAWLPIALGIFLSLKQYNVIFLPLIFLILPQPIGWKTTIKFLAITLVTGAVVSLPLALWDWGAFWNSNVTIQIKQPFRYDAFSFLALYANAQPRGFEPPGWWSMIPFMLIVPTWCVLLWRMPRNIAGFVMGVALVTIVFLFSNRQAFLNYHTFAAGALLLSIAAVESTLKPDSTPTGDPAPVQ